MTKAELLTFLASVRSHYATYHNHKETAAWLAVVLFTAIALQLGAAMPQVAPQSVRLTITLFVVGLVLISCLYVFMEARAGRRASEYVSGCLLLESRILAVSDKDFDPAAYSMEEGSDTRMQSERVLPRFIREAADYVATSVRGRVGITLHYARYLLLALVAALSLFRAWAV
jgi:hypothetical protein